MESEQRHYELRSGSRSRSRTPLVQNRASVECLRIRSQEGSHVSGDVTETRRFNPTFTPLGSNKKNEENMETMAERKEEVVDKRAMNSFPGTEKMERRSERQKTKRHTFANGQTESKDDSIRPKAEKTSKNISQQRIFTSDYSSEEGEREDLSNRPGSAHEIYTKAGDWWNVFPKTDYTYSEKSQCRYEIAPGILAMPNMSRRSIRSDTDDSNRFSRSLSDCDLYETANMAIEKGATKNSRLIDEYLGSRMSNSDRESTVSYTKASVEQHRCHREIIYPASQGTTNLGSRQTLSTDSSQRRIATRKCNLMSSVDSDAELEDAVSSNCNSRQRRPTQQLIMGSTSTIALRLRKLLEFLKLKTIKRREYHATYEYQQYESKWFGIWRHLDRFFQYVYLFMVKVFFFDSWLLSRVSGVRGWMRQRSPKVLWIALLPLLLLTGCWCLPYSSTLFLPGKIIARRLRESPVISVRGGRESTNYETYGKGDDFESVIDKLSSRIGSLEDRTVQHSDRLLNVSLVLQQLRESEYIWSKYNNEISQLEKGLVGQKLDGVYTQEIDVIKSQFEKLKEMYSELKLCCHIHTNCVSNEDLGKRIEMILIDYIDTLALKKGLVKVHEELSMVKDTAVVTDDRVREIVKEALKVYDADKTGRVDYALESAGGQVISTRCTQRYDIKTRAFKLLAFTLYHENNNPRSVIQGNPIQPGACWAFQGFPGYLLIKLRSSIYVTGFTVEHAPKSILPNGEMKSAPKMFNVWGFVDENDPEPFMFGDYEFAASADNLQYFPVQNTSIKTSYEYVELRVHSNHGQLEYTCLYRFRVHGKPV